jgi:hypothetical protein
MPASASHLIFFSTVDFLAYSRQATYSVGRKRLKQAHNLSEEVNCFLTRRIPCITTRAQSRNTSPMRLPLMIPESLITLIIRHPVRLHII